MNELKSFKTEEEKQKFFDLSELSLEDGSFWAFLILMLALTSPDSEISKTDIEE